MLHDIIIIHKRIIFAKISKLYLPKYVFSVILYTNNKKYEANNMSITWNAEKTEIQTMTKSTVVAVRFTAEFNSSAWKFAEAQWRDIGKENPSWQKYLQEKTKEW